MKSKMRLIAAAAFCVLGWFGAPSSHAMPSFGLSVAGQPAGGFLPSSLITASVGLSLGLENVADGEFTLSFDPAVLTFQSVSRGALIPADWSVIDGPGVGAGQRIVSAFSGGSLITGSGHFADLIFQVNPNAASGSTILLGLNAVLDELLQVQSVDPDTGDPLFDPAGDPILEIRIVPINASIDSVSLLIASTQRLPEPASAVLLLTALFCFAWDRRRRLVVSQ